MTRNRLLHKKSVVNDESMLAILDAMETPEGLQAATHVKLEGSIIARDALRVGMDTAAFQPARSARIVRSLARHIGLQTSLDSEEEEGKIFHEYRSLTLGGKPAGETATQIFDFLSPRWGGNEREFTYFGSMDATASYVMLVARHVRLHGDGLLSEAFVHHRSGQTMRIYDTIVMAAEFYLQKIEQSLLGLVEYVRLNKAYGFWYQTSRESADSLVLPDGSLPNIDAKLAFFELQTLVRASLREAAFLVGDRKLRERWRFAADALQSATIAHFWDHEQTRFARALHRDADGQPTQISMNDSALAETLVDDPFSGASEADEERFVSSIIRPLYGDMLTDVGFRMQSMTHASSVDYWSYAGAHVIFPSTTKRIADGLFAQEFPELGVDADQRLVAGVEAAGGFPDVHFVDDDGQLVLAFEGRQTVPTFAEVISATTLPKMHQAWTVSGVLASRRRDSKARARAGWRTSLVAEIEHQLREAYESAVEAPVPSAPSSRRWFDAVDGQEKERAFVRQSGRASNSVIVPMRPKRTE